MNRRDFLKTIAGAAMLNSGILDLPFSSSISAFALDRSRSTQSANKLVVVFLRGALDGLSAVVPYSDPQYYSLRPKIAIPKPGQEGGVIKLDGDFGLHPNLAPLLSFWQNKSLAFVANSGSPDPTRSHFDAQDYMESGLPGVKAGSTGWLNRLLKELPDNGSPVRALNVGTTTPRILQGPIACATYAPSNRKKVSAIESPYIARAFEKMYEDRKDDLGQAFREGMEARATINEKLSDTMTAADQGAVQANKFSGFGKQVGKLIREEPKIQVAFVDLGGFDTHVNQGAAQGQLANNLNVVGKGLAELANSLGSSFERTLIVVMSEFGRTVKENGNGGTDHGHGNFIWLLGGPVEGGKIFGKWNGIAQKNLYEGRDLPVYSDFRGVLKTTVAEHMGLSQKQAETIFPGFKAQENLRLLKG